MLLRNVVEDQMEEDRVQNLFRKGAGEKKMTVYEEFGRIQSKKCQELGAGERSMVE